MNAYPMVSRLRVEKACERVWRGGIGAALVLLIVCGAEFFGNHYKLAALFAALAAVTAGIAVGACLVRAEMEDG